MKQKPDGGGPPDVIGRRHVIAMLGGAVIAAPRAVGAQQAAMPGHRLSQLQISARVEAPSTKGFIKGLAEGDFVVGRDALIECR